MDLRPGGIIFEALPPPATAKAGACDALLDQLEPLAHAGLQAVNVPEIVEGQYATQDPACFGASLQQRLGVPAIVNKVTVHQPLLELEAWVRHVRQEHGIHHAMFVGGDASSIQYPGPSLAQALPALARRIHDHGGQVGVVAIPSRRGGTPDEPIRLQNKHKAGADFAISQILMESSSAVALRADVEDAGCTMPIFWSLSPVVRQRDLAFLRWLGVEIPADVHKLLSDAMGTGARLRRSLELSEAIATDLIAHAQLARRPVSFCIEHVMARNVEPAIELVERIRDLCRSEALPAAPGLQLG